MHSSRKKHQIDLFENLEKELKSIVEVFNRERLAKRKELEQLRQSLKERDDQLKKEKDWNHKEKTDIINKWK